MTKRIRALRITVLILTVIACSLKVAVVCQAFPQTQVTQPQATTLAANQLRLKILAVEWAKCNASGPGDPTAVPPRLPWSCVGLELYRFRYADGSFKVFLASEPPPDFVKDAKWIDQLP